MARPREHSDDELLHLIGAALAHRTALSRWSLADIAREIGVAPATLVRRFGSRHGLLVTLSQHWVDSIPTAPVRTNILEELTEWVSSNFEPRPDRSAAVVGMQFLMEDLSDDEVAGLLTKGWTKQVDYLATLLARAGLARLDDPRAGAQLLFDALNGCQLRVAAGDPHSPSALTTVQFLWEAWK